MLMQNYVVVRLIAWYVKICYLHAYRWIQWRHYWTLKLRSAVSNKFALSQGILQQIQTKVQFRLSQLCSWGLALRGCYTAWVGSWLPTFRYNRFVPWSRFLACFWWTITAYTGACLIAQRPVPELFSLCSLPEEGNGTLFRNVSDQLRHTPKEWRPQMLADTCLDPSAADVVWVDYGCCRWLCYIGFVF
jgi:hypothetical protein